MLNIQTEQQYNEIVENYSDMIFRIAYQYLFNKYDAEDIVQEVFVKLLTKRVIFKDEEHIKSWLIRVTINQCLDYKKSFLTVIYCHSHLLLIDVLRQRKLNDESVNIIILVQLIYTPQELFFGNILLITDEGRLKSTLLAGQHLVFHIGFTASVVPYEHGYQVWLLASVGNNLCHLLGYLFLDGGCRRLSVD